MNIRTFIYSIMGKRHLASAEAYEKWLREKGIKIGNNLKIFGFGGRTRPTIDVTRPSLVEIGDNVQLNRNFTLLTHDYVSGQFLVKYDDFLPSSGRVKIGNNVGFGMDCMVLKGVTIGDNCFIGAGSVVTKDIPANSIAVGRPAKVVCTMDEYYERRKTEITQEAFAYARSIKEQYGRMPVAADFWEEFSLFVDAHNVDDYPEINLRVRLGRHYQKWADNHQQAPYNGLQAFLDAAFKKESK